MTKYKTWSDTITPVECVKETANSVWIKTNWGVRMYRKTAQYDRCFDTHAEAVAHVINEAQIKVDAAETSLNYYQSELAKVKAKFKKVAA